MQLKGYSIYYIQIMFSLALTIWHGSSHHPAQTSHNKFNISCDTLRNLKRILVKGCIKIFEMFVSWTSTVPTTRNLFSWGLWLHYRLIRIPIILNGGFTIACFIEEMVDLNSVTNTETFCRYTHLKKTSQC